MGVIALSRIGSILAVKTDEVAGGAMSTIPHVPTLLASLLSAALFFSAGASLFLMLVNRILIGLDIRTGKHILIVMIGLSMTVLPAFYGYTLGWSEWVLLPTAVLGFVVYGEARRLLIRRRHRGSPPVSEGGIDRFRIMTTTNLQVTRYETRHPRWRGPELRVAHISDVHMRDAYPRSYLADIVRRIHDVDPEVVLVTGDFVTGLRHLARLPELLRPIAASFPTFGVLGNHDYWLDADAVARVVRSCDVKLLGDESWTLDRGGGARILLRGYEHPWGRDGFMRTIDPADTFMIVLTHTPDNVYRLSKAGAQAVFAGHFHAGQIRVPRIGPIVVPSRYGRRFDHGHFIVNGTYLFATAGVGSSNPPFRIFCPPEIQVVDFLPPVTER
jgi:predicted MPP superfamily phosphohydrolase